MAGQRGRYLLACAALAAGTLLTYFSPLLVRGAVDGLIDSNASRGIIAQAFANLRQQTSLSTALFFAGLLVIAATAAGGALVYLKGRWAARATEEIIRTLRLRLYNHLQHVPMAWHDKSQTGDIVQRCTSDVETVRNFYAAQVIDVLQNLSRILIVVPILFLLDWRMALASTALMPIIIGFTAFFFRRVQGTFKKSDEAEGALSARLQENLTGIRVVRAFARQDFEKTVFEERNATDRAARWKLYKLLSIFWASSDFLCFSQTALLILTGIWSVQSGRITVGTFIAFVTYGQMFIWPLREMGRTLTEVGKALVSIGRIQEVLAVPEESAPAAPAGGPSNSNPAFPGRLRGDIEFQNVHFSHGTAEVLRGVTLKIPAGSTVALLGPSGSGKTTLVNILLRMYDYDSGRVTLGGLELAQLDRKYVRSQFGVVLQEPFLFSKTLAENMRLGRHTASDEEVFAAAHVAAIHETVESFEQKYATLIGERGVTLSGGQRQRTAIARALLRDAPILILDDALSAVDTHTEAAILASLKRGHALGHRTTILIAHRLSTLMHADQIAVMEHGRIVQLGTHNQLIAQDGLYRRLWQIQSALEDDLRTDLNNDGQRRATLEIALDTDLNPGGITHAN